MQFFARERDTIKIYRAQEDATGPTPLDPQMQLPFPEVARWAPNGRLLGLVDPNRAVMIIVLSDEAGDITVQPLPESAATTKQLWWSTQSTFLTTLHPHAENDPNLVVWNVSASVPVARFAFPRWREKQLWPAIKWSDDERLCVRCEGHSLVVMDGQSLRSLHTVRTDTMPSFELAPASDPYHLVVFSPEHRDTDLERTIVAEGYVEMVTWDGTDATVRRLLDVPAAETCEIKWSPSGKHCLIHAHTAVDESGQNYYGASRVLLVSMDGTVLEITADSVATGTPGKVEKEPNGQTLMLQAIAWSPHVDEFVLITGFQPSVAALWSMEGGCRKAWSFPERLHRNTIRWNCFGNLVALGGFGNLAGDLDFWLREDEGFVRCGSTKAECTVSCEWAPNGRHFLTAVLAPRMRVDNAVTVWRGLCGQQVHTQRFHELFEAVWKPGAGSPLTDEEVQVCRAAAAKGREQGVQRKVYRPPGARGGADEQNSVSARMRSQQGIDDAITRRNGRTAKAKGKGDERNSPQREHALSADFKGDPRAEDVRKGDVPRMPEKGDKGKGKGRPQSPEMRPATPPKPKLPDQGWAYVDTTGKVQGPFALAEMRAWHTHGYFKPDLRIRCREGDSFTPLKDMYPTGDSAFTTTPCVLP